MRRLFRRGQVKRGQDLSLWDKFMIWRNGKRFAILGPCESGKTHLSKYLTEGAIPASYNATINIEPRDIYRLKIEDLDFKEAIKLGVKKSFDVNGDIKYAFGKKGQWVRALEGADIVLFLFNVSKRADSLYYTQAMDGAHMLRKWFRERGARPLYLVLTHADMLPGYESTPKFYGQVRKLKEVEQVAIMLDNTRILVAGMPDIEGTEDFVIRLIKDLEGQKIL